MICEARVGGAMKNVKVLSRTIFYCAVDRMAQKFFVCIIVGLFRSIYCRVHTSGMQWYIF